MDVAIAGASGLIGSALTRALSAAGHRPRPLLRPSSLPHPDGIRWDPVGGWIDGQSLARVGAIVNLAGESIGAKPWTKRHKRAIRDSRIRSTRLLAGAIAAMPPPRPVFVSASASGYYGDRGDEVLTETSAPGTGFLPDVCVRWEAEAAAAGTRIVLLRSGIVLDSGGGLLKRLLPLFRLGLGGRLGSGKQWMPWITLQDQVRAIVHVIERDECAGPFNLCAPDPIRNEQFTRLLAGAVNRPAALAVPRFALQTVFGRDAVRDAFCASANMIPSALADAGFDFTSPQAGPALRQMTREAAGRIGRFPSRRT